MRHDEQAILIFALEAEMTGKDRAVGKPRLHRKAHVDAGLGMTGPRQRRDLRWRTAAEHTHQGGGIGTHVQKAAAAKLAVIAKIGDRQRRNDELGVNMRERAVAGNKAAQRFEMRVIAEYGSLGDDAARAPSC